MSAINKCSNLSAPSPNRISWKHLKTIVKDEECLGNIVNIASVVATTSRNDPVVCLLQQSS